MNADSQWESLVEDYASSLRALQDSAQSALASAEGGAALSRHAAEHLSKSISVRTYLAGRLGSREGGEAAARALGIATSTDLWVAGLLIQADTPVRGIAPVEPLQVLDIAELRSDLLGTPQGTAGTESLAMAGPPGEPPAVPGEIPAACHDVLAQAGKIGKQLVTGLVTSVTADEVIGGLSKLSSPIAAKIEGLEAGLSVLRKRVLDFIDEYLAKLAQLINVNISLGQVETELRDLWTRVSGDAENWAEAVLGRSRVLQDWQTWLSTSPAPTAEQVRDSVVQAQALTAAHENQLKWAGRAVGAFGYVEGWLAGLTYGLEAVAVIAAALGGSVVWITWDDLHDIAGAATTHR